MNVNSVWTWGGHYFGYIEDNILFTYKGKSVGLLHHNEIYDRQGNYVGELTDNEYLITNPMLLSKRGPSCPSVIGHPQTPAVNRSHIMRAGYKDFPGCKYFDSII